MNAPSIGLLCRSTGAQVALKAVQIDVTATERFARTTVTQSYVNDEASPIEAVYLFPIDPGAAVCSFVARVGERTIRAEVAERDEAFERYDDAMAQGHGAVLLDQERPDVFTVSLGNVAPGEAVSLEIATVALLRREGTAIRLQIPTTVAPRYVPSVTEPAVGPSQGERVNAPRVGAAPYGLRFRAVLSVPGGLRRVESPTHPIRTTTEAGIATVELAREDAALDRDITILFEPALTGVPQALARQDGDATIVAVTFHPDVEALTGEGGQRGQRGQEVVFVIDCSGSMQGESIHQARRALLLCLAALEPGDTFNIVRFGSSFESLWPAARAYGDATLAEARLWVEPKDADLGGTEILAPLRSVLAQAPDPQRPRQVLVLTDGEVSNEHEVISLCRDHAGAARVFSFGIGAGASAHLVEGIARASRGASEFIHPGERVEPKVLRQFGRLRTPALRDLSVDWGTLSFEQAPSACPPVFAGDPVTVFARLSGAAPSEVVLRAGEHRWSVPVSAATDAPLPELWCRERIRELESQLAHGEARAGSQQGERGRRRHPVESQLVDLGRRYGLASSVTSFVGVIEREEGRLVDQPPQLRRIPIALTAGWGAAPAISAMMMPTAAPARMAPMAAASPASMPQARSSGPMPQAHQGRAPKQKRRLFGGRQQEPEFAVRADQPVAAPPKEGSAGATGEPDLYAVLLTQLADGSFRLSETLLSWFGGPAEEVRSAGALHGEAMIATWMVVLCLEGRESARADEWRAAAAKARRWLDGQPGSPAAAQSISHLF